MPYPSHLLRIATTRKAALRNLPSLLKNFRANAEKPHSPLHVTARGARSNPAHYPGEQCDFVVKSKPMNSEEILLNPYLEKAGIRCLETDRGKWIIQLCRNTMDMLGYDVTFPKRTVCCDIPARYSGE